MTEELIKKIEEASVHVPTEWAEKIASGEARAYTQGILAGRAQAVAIIKGQE